MNESGDAVPSHVTPDVLRAPALADLSDEEIRERMSGNICRCGAYPNIVDAVKHAREVQPRSAHPDVKKADGKKEDGKKAGRK